LSNIRDGLSRPLVGTDIDRRDLFIAQVRP
jgi:hypothetical protein